jgi:hypothetical protein
LKALSFRQPRAEQIMRGVKTVDIRTWCVHHRGPLAVHASSTRRDARCRALGFDPDALAYGALLGTVELVDVVPLDKADYEAMRDAHRLEGRYPGKPCYAWTFAEPARFDRPIPYRGRMSLFNVEPDAPPGDEEDAQAPAARKRQPVPYRTTPAPAPDPARPFVLYAIPERGNGYRVALYQWLQRDGGGDARAPGAMWEIEVGGDALRAVADHLLHALRANGYKATDLAPTTDRETRFYLDELTGIKLALILMAVKPLRRHDRIEAIGRGLHAMGDEEAYYWFSKCSAGAEAARARKALRILLSDE